MDTDEEEFDQTPVTITFPRGWVTDALVEFDTYSNKELVESYYGLLIQLAEKITEADAS